MDSSVSPKDEIWFLRLSSHFKRILRQVVKADEQTGGGKAITTTRPTFGK